MNYIALDFETANSQKGGACSIGLAKFDEEGEVVDTFYSLIRPKLTYFDPFMTRVHGLSSSECLAAPKFDYLWPEILNFVGNNIVVAHNLTFDYKVLEGTLDVYDLPHPRNVFYCTLQISRKTWPHFKSHKLTVLSENFELNYRAHHALDDAVNCGKIFKIACGDKTFERPRLVNYLDNYLKVKSRVMFKEDFLF